MSLRYKKFLNLKLSEIGIGTYLGNPDDKTDENYYQTIKEGIEKGINVIDTAINYRNMRSEKVIGKVLKEIDREKVILSTKGGYVAVPYGVENPTEWFKRELVLTKIVDVKDITDTGNILTSKYINWAFETSLKNLNTDYIDVYFIHNPEDQLLKFDRETFYKKLKEVFEVLEEKRIKGKLKYYGLATWNGFRVPENHKQYLNLKEILDIAYGVAGNNNGFKFIQLPYNIAMLEAYNLKNQNLDGKKLSTLEASEKLGIYTYISAPLMQGRLIRAVNEIILQRFKVDKPSLIPIQFVRSTKGVGTVLIGMSQKEHLIENLEIENKESLSFNEIDNMINSR